MNYNSKLVFKNLLEKILNEDDGNIIPPDWRPEDLDPYQFNPDRYFPRTPTNPSGGGGGGPTTVDDNSVRPVDPGFSTYDQRPTDPSSVRPSVIRPDAPWRGIWDNPNLPGGLPLTEENWQSFIEYYRAIFGRDPDPDTFADFLRWMGQSGAVTTFNGKPTFYFGGYYWYYRQNPETGGWGWGRVPKENKKLYDYKPSWFGRNGWDSLRQGMFGEPPTHFWNLPDPPPWIPGVGYPAMDPAMFERYLQNREFADNIERILRGLLERYNEFDSNGIFRNRGLLIKYLKMMGLSVTDDLNVFDRLTLLKQILKSGRIPKNIFRAIEDFMERVGRVFLTQMLPVDGYGNDYELDPNLGDWNAGMGGGYGGGMDGNGIIGESREIINIYKHKLIQGM